MTDPFPGQITRLHLETVSSTNDLARAYAREGAPHLTLITADSQLAGRGRTTRRWVSPKGNLYSSLILRPDAQWPDSATLPHVAALAIHDCITRSLPDHPDIRLKWPNDVLVDQRKISGALIEAAHFGRLSGDEHGRQRKGRQNTLPAFVIVGIGINVCICPHIPDHKGGAVPVTSLLEAGSALPADQECDIICLRLMEAFLNRLDRWIEGGFAAIKVDYLKASLPLGADLCIRLPGKCEQYIPGKFAGVNDTGHLCLDTDRGREVFLSGDIICHTQ